MSEKAHDLIGSTKQKPCSGGFVSSAATGSEKEPMNNKIVRRLYRPESDTDWREGKPNNGKYVYVSLEGLFGRHEDMSIEGIT